MPKIWAVIYDNEFGLEVTLYKSFEEANEALRQYVIDYWDKEINPNPYEVKHPLPDVLSEDDIEYYFNIAEERAEIAEVNLPEGF